LITFHGDEQANESRVLIHWIGGRHTELRLARRRGREIPDEARPLAVEAMRKLGGRYSDRELAVTLNRMRCKSDDGSSWTVGADGKEMPNPQHLGHCP